MMGVFGGGAFANAMGDSCVMGKTRSWDDGRPVWWGESGGIASWVFSFIQARRGRDAIASREARLDERAMDDANADLAVRENTRDKDG